MSRNGTFVRYALRFFPKCQWCLASLTKDQSTADHIRPRSRGGSNRWDNLLLSCYDCNHKRGNKTLPWHNGKWHGKRVPRPHGPMWTGPTRNQDKKAPTKYWCECCVRRKMLIEVKPIEVDVWSLFVTEGFLPYPIDPPTLADQISELINCELVKRKSDLSVSVAWSHDYLAMVMRIDHGDDFYWKNGASSVVMYRDRLPHDVVAAIDAISQERIML